MLVSAEPIEERFKRLDVRIEKTKSELNLFYKDIGVKLKTWAQNEKT